MTTPADRALLVDLYAAAGRFDAAEREARKLAAESAGDREAKLRLANVLAWNKKFAEAAPLYDDLARTDPADVRLPPRLAALALATGDAAGALKRYAELLAGNWDQPELWAGYIDAAAAVKDLPAEPHKATVLRIAERVMADPPRDGERLARLGWVLRRVKEPQKGLAALRRAQAASPESREVRTQLAEALSAAGQYAEAEKLFRGLLRAEASRRP
jgi:predicted Zn-dependent protease